MGARTNDYDRSKGLECPSDDASTRPVIFESLLADITNRFGPESGCSTAVSSCDSRVIVATPGTDLLDIDPVNAGPDIDGSKVDFNCGTGVPVGHSFTDELCGSRVSSQRAGGGCDKGNNKKQSVEHDTSYSCKDTWHRRAHSARNQEVSVAFHHPEIEPFPAYPSRAASPRVFGLVVFGLVFGTALLAIAALFSVQLIAAHERMFEIDRRIALEVRL